MTTAVPTLINNRWTLLLPQHRADRQEWPVWERERIAHMHDTIKPGMVVFDIGAEEGDLPALWCSWGARVALFEPNPRVWPNIRFIWEANNLPRPAGWFAGFAAANTDRMPPHAEPIFREPDRDGWPACAYGPIIGDHGFRNVCERYHDTPSVRLDDYCRDTGLQPDVITMDVEGAEFEVLRGAEETLRTERPIVYVSIHPEFMAQKHGYTDAALHGFMATLGYDSEHIATDHEEHWVFTP